MKITNLLILSFLLTFITVFSQKKYENGYYVNNQNQKNSILIYNEDWLENPISIKVKNSNGEEQILNISEIKQFGFDNGVSYERYSVDYDKSSEDLEKLSVKYAPEYIKKTVFLKKIVDGKYPLYEYYGENIYKYFYMDQNMNIIPLVYKMFYPQKPNSVYMNKTEMSYNKTYQNQILELSDNKVKTNGLGYDYRHLVNVFNKINGNVQQKEHKKLDYFGAKVGVTLTTSKMTTAGLINQIPEFKLGNAISPSLGVFYEHVFPFEKNKFSFVVEANYYSKVTLQNEYVLYDGVSSTYFTHKPEVSFSAYNIGLGGKVKFFINKDLNIYLKPMLFYEGFIGPKVIWQHNLEMPTYETSFILSGSVGVQYKGFFLEFPNYRSPKISGVDKTISNTISFGYSF